jgi:C-terminal peptidase prc
MMRPPSLRWLIPFALVVLLLASCGNSSDESSDTTVAPTTTEATTTTTVAPTTTAAPTTTINAATAEFLESFEFVWATINEGFYDSDFGGVDWVAVHDRYRPQIAAAQTGMAAFFLINTMLWELGVSHIGMMPADDPGLLDLVLTSEGELGIDVRLLDDEWVITEVKPGSPAAEAGLRVGYLLESIGGQSVDEIADVASSPMPPRHERGVRSGEIMGVQTALYGEPGAVVTVGYRDGDDQPGQAVLTFRQRGSSAEILPGIPPVFTTMEVDRLEGGIGYVRFDAFAPGLLAPLLDAIDTMQDAPGLIIDLRGNRGGVFSVRKPLIDRLVNEPALIWTYLRRSARDDVFADPAEVTYDGPVVVLVDVLSASSAEEFAGALQAIGRAFVIGERTAGRDLVADFAELPDGALLIYPVAQTLVADGTVLEGHGVIPDLPIAVHRSDLLVGIDSPLQAAIDHLQSSDS